MELPFRLLQEELTPCYTKMSGATVVCLVIYRDAVALALSRLTSDDQLLRKLYTDWASALIQESNYEQAAQW